MSSTEDQAALIALRRRVLTTRPPLSDALTTWAREDAGHAFLANPAAQLSYRALVRYVVDAAARWRGKPPAALRVLDWGCGKGHVLYLLREEGVPVVSADRTSGGGDSAFGQATPILRHAGIDVVPLTDDVTLPFGDATFDVVLSFGVLEHVPNDAASLRELARVLQPGGLFFCFFLPYTASWTQRLAHLRGDRYHDRLYGRRQLRALLTGADLRLLDLWFRQLLPKNSVRYPAPWAFERVDQWLTERTPLRYFATNVECVAVRG